jgi:hypothetical protein
VVPKSSWSIAGGIGWSGRQNDDWLSKIENNRANLDRLSVIKALADALDVTVGDLLGEPALLDWTRSSSGRPVGVLREALIDYPALTPSLRHAQPVEVNSLRTGVREVWSAYQAARFSYVTGRLPRLLADAQATAQTTSADDRREAYRSLALAYHAAATVLTKLGETELAWIASDRGLTAAEMSEDPAALAALLRSVAHSLLSNSRYEAAAHVVTSAGDRLAPVDFGPAPKKWSLLGTLFLVGAMSAARANRPSESREFLARARQAGARLGSDANYAWTAVGPTNVAVHEVSVAVELGDIQRAAALAPTVDATSLQVERRIRHALEVARVYSMINRSDDALAVLLHAERDAPEQVRSHFISRELVLRWLRSQRAKPRAELDLLARRLHVA